MYQTNQYEGMLAETITMQGHKGDVGARLLEPPDEIDAGVERDHLVPEARERVLDPGAGSKRHLTLERPPPFEHCDLHCESLRRKGSTVPASARPSADPAVPGGEAIPASLGSPLARAR